MNSIQESNQEYNRSQFGESVVQYSHNSNRSNVLLQWDWRCAAIPFALSIGQAIDRALREHQNRI